MSNKLTWKKIYDDFRQRHPTLRKHVMHWQPYSYATIVLRMDDGCEFTYNYDEHMLKRSVKKGA